MNYLPLDQVDKPVLTTQECAHYLNRKPQTLRMWSHKKSGPISPIVILGRLGWKTKEVKALLGMPV